MSDNQSSNRLHLLIIILIAICLALISGFALGSYSSNASQQTQITAPPSLAQVQVTESPNDCTLISSLPYTINAGGTYCLNESLTTDEHGITINADNVLLDFDGYSVHGTRDPNNIFYGIYANNRSNLHIKNGEITGFFYAMRFDDSSYGLSEPFESGWHTIENMEISHSTFRGIFITGNGNVVQNSIIRHIQGNLVYENSFAIGIESVGPGTLIQDNYIYNVRGMGTSDVGEGIGIAISDRGEGSIVTNNIITNDSLEESNITDWNGLSRSTWGIWVGGASNATISYNQIHNYMFGIAITSNATNTMIHNNSIMLSYTAIHLPPLVDRITAYPHIVYDNVCENEICLSTRIFPTGAP